MTADPFLAEAALAVIARSPKPSSRTDVAAALRTTGGDAGSALRLLINEGLVREVGSNYEATPLGRKRVSEAMAADMDGNLQDEADSITAAFVALDPDSQRALLAASMFAMAPEVYAEAAESHFNEAARQFAEGRRLDGGQFANGPRRAYRARLAALDSLVAAARTVDPTADRVSVMRSMIRSAGRRPKVLSAALVAAAAPTPAAIVASAHAARRTEKRAPRSAPAAPSNATGAAGATCCGTPVTDASRPCNCGWPPR